MHRARLGFTFAVSAAALAAALTIALTPTAEAQQRKSIRWSTSSVDSYGYKVAASMTKIVEEALGGEYTVTVNPYPSTTGAMKAAMDGDGEIGYTADVGMTQLYEGSGGFKDYNPGKGRLVLRPCAVVGVLIGTHVLLGAREIRATAHVARRPPNPHVEDQRPWSCG